ncbi:hypothetical protein B4065_1794 [Caldibacillus thermoamylovorans]|nr:hypothetical protein B4065_1794 [Caldibacillus thermoamylovorans]
METPFIETVHVDGRLIFVFAELRFLFHLKHSFVLIEKQEKRGNSPLSILENVSYTIGSRMLPTISF